MVGNTLLSAGVGLLVEKGFALAVQGIDNYIHKDDKLIERGEEAKNTILEQTQAYQTQKESLGELTSKYAELSKGVKISGNTIKNVSLTDDQYQEFLDTSNQIANAAPTLAKTWDSQGNAILNAGTNASKLNNQVSDYLKLQRDLTYYNTKDNIEKQYEGVQAALRKNNEQAQVKEADRNAIESRNRYATNFLNALEKSKTQKGEKTFTLDHNTYAQIADLLSSDAFVNYDEKDNGEVTLTLDMGALTSDDFQGIQSKVSDIQSSTSKDLEEAQTKLSELNQASDTTKKELMTSARSMVDTIDSFDSWADQDKAETFRSTLSSMMASSDTNKLYKDFEKSDKDMDSWLRSNIVNPMA